MTDHRDRLAGILLGTALGDALGLPMEGLSARTIARRFGAVDRFHLLGRTGFVSDDTEQAALVAQCLARFPDDPDGCVRAFRRSLLGWFARLPWGVGRATILASLRIALGLKRSGIRSAGNGAAMRAAIVGGFFADRPEERLRFGRALAEVTHTDPRAIEGALYVAEVAAGCVAGLDRLESCRRARRAVTVDELARNLDRAFDLAARGADIAEAASLCGHTGYVVHTAALATFAFLRHGDDPLRAIQLAISAGGDTDSIAAIVGAWTGSLVGERGLPASQLSHLHDGPFGPTHLRALASCLSRIQQNEPAPVPRYSWPAALLRNLLLIPLILAHGLRRLWPW